jgi:dienelactone hydrolase
MRASRISRDWKYVAFVADIYGIDNSNVTDADEQDAMSTMWRSNATRFAERIQTAVNTASETWGLLVQRVALVGYGLGGTGVLSHAMVGWETVDAVVAFHADGLDALPTPASVVTPKVLVFSGEETDTSTTVMELEGAMNSVNATWEITRLSGVGGEFTDAQDAGFNDWADYRAWVSTQNFLRDALASNGSSYYRSPYQAGFLEDPSPPESINVKSALYDDDDGTQLKGYIAQPDATSFVSPHPTVIILP